MQHTPLSLAQALLKIDSVTPDDKGCQQLIADFLQPLGFNIEPMPFEEVSNLWATRGETGPFIVFAGHTDVVPTGPVDKWTHPPFAAQVDQDVLFARGAADMKGSIACFMIACERFVNRYPDAAGRIGFLITSDEEGPAINGTVKVIETLEARGEKFDYCLVGEPSSSKQLGDSIKNGRRGSISGHLTIKGKQGHIAYPHLAKNPIHAFSPVLEALINQAWDEGNAYFPPTSFQISNIHSGTGATNVIPGDCVIDFNFRFSTEQTPDTIKAGVHKILDDAKVEYTLDWTLSGLPFITEASGHLISATVQAVETVMGFSPKLSTSGGTSDGRFIAQTGAQVIELGPLNATIHQINEQVPVVHLEQLTDIYLQVLVNLLVK